MIWPSVWVWLVVAGIVAAVLWWDTKRQVYKITRRHKHD